MTNRLILDTDGGVDDAQALLMLLANDRAPFAITTVFGNVGLDAATANILDVLAVAGSDIPVHAGADRPLVAPIVDARDIHGEDGLGGAIRPDSAAEPSGLDGVGFLVDALLEAAAIGERIDILAIGPLTNIALMLRLAPEAVEGLGTLTIMGGTLNGRGNITPAAEFNIYADPEAAAAVFRSVPSVIVPWEPCTTHLLTGEEVEAAFEGLAQADVTQFSLALAQHARRTSLSYGGADVLRFVDPLAAAVVISPEIVTTSLEASVDVALAEGVTRGMTVVDPSFRLGTPRARLVETVDETALRALYARSIAG
ncbi:non-specific riboncleoside hydrolase [Devosia enhydra]|uniref:Non-specific riboncleoside hydrolase n=1 Tax=Devosia enhydra TaxID=665118 RepID=A0A1K2I2B2_9HYPH|nr:nucleoside hydrolase [Devosia enhydra]SFZ86473.1 non-specific riboncleoside hydrolase [Devosia enhydra]